MTLKLPTAFVLIFTLVLATVAPVTVAQTRRQTPARPRAQTPAPPTTPTPPPPTFDTLLAANSYRLYVEVRSVGQLIRSNSINEILDPIMKLASPPKEFRTVVKWLNTHADEVMTSRAFFASWPGKEGLPSELVAIEFASPEEATKFQQRLKEFLPKVIPAPTPESSPAQTAPPELPFHLRQTGSLILVTSQPFKIEQLRSAGSKLLAEDVNFRVARNRFNSEPIFIFFDVAAVEKDEQEQEKKLEEQRKQAIADAKVDEKTIAESQARLQRELEEPEEEVELTPPQTGDPQIAGTIVNSGAAGQAPPEMTRAQQLSYAFVLFSFLMSSYGPEESKWPEALGVAISLEGESFDVRALLINAPGKQSDPLPFLPLLKPGPPLSLESANILPADTEMIVTLSLDLPSLYAMISKPRPFMALSDSQMTPEQIKQMESPYEELEKRLKIKIKDDLLPLLGPEVVISMPLGGLDLLQPPRAAQPESSSSPTPSPSPSPSPDSSSSSSSSDNFTLSESYTVQEQMFSPTLLFSLKDKEAMRILLPKMIEAAAFKGANAFASTERREDTELVSYANLLSYAFIGNFLVIGPDVKATRHVVDSYLKHQTLAGDPQFKNATRWQPRMVQAQLYVSPALMEGYRTWVQQPSNTIDEQLRAMLTRLTIVPQPITYSLSNEGFGPLHELHLPKNMVLMFIASMAGASKAATVVEEPKSDNPN